MNKRNPVILVIDDDPTFCHLMKRVGEQKQFKVIAYSSAENAYRDMQSLDFDVAVIDYDLGRVTGAQLTNYMKRMEHKQPIVLVSSSNIAGRAGWSDQVIGIESKTSGAFNVFSNVLRAFDRFTQETDR